MESTPFGQIGQPHQTPRPGRIRHIFVATPLKTKPAASVPPLQRKRRKQL
jgi:hypothetical protein